MKELLSDNGTEIHVIVVSRIMSMHGHQPFANDFLSSLNVTPSCERFHRTLNSILAKIMDDHQKTWDDFVPYAIAAYRNTVHKSTGHTPNMIVYGQEVSNPVDIVLGDFSPNQGCG